MVNLGVFGTAKPQTGQGLGKTGDVVSVTDFGVQCVVVAMLVIAAMLAGLYGWAAFALRKELKQIEGDTDE